VIRYLAIRNLAVLEQVSVEFEHSFNILTGETGAGKSILVEAVGLLLGGRASQELIRTGAELATVEAIFASGDDEVVVRREITIQGRSRAFVDGTLATAAALKSLAERFVELHGQHEHQLLLDPVHHLPLVDAWAGLATIQAAVGRAFHEVRELRLKLDRRQMDARERAARLELVELQLGELMRAALRPGEDEELAAERQVLRQADTIRRLCAESYADLYESDTAALTNLGRVWKRLAELAAIEPRFAPANDEGAAIKAQLDDLALALRDYAERLDDSPERLETIERRLAALERIRRVFGGSIDAAIARRDELAAERLALTASGETAEELEHALADASSRFLTRARELSRARHAAARRFATALQAELAELAMAGTSFEVRVETDEDPSRWSERGIDTGEFYLSANLGEAVRPLARIVSGGELSRIMLAMKTLAAGESADRTLIFDEVDAGIGGRVATVVGQKLRALGARTQVLCISHLPQIAAAATTHVRIDKTVRQGRTVTSVSRLSEQERVDELARMLAGADAGDQARANARELLAAAATRAQADSRRAPQAKAKVGQGRKAKPGAHGS
jgi:DNA repair protein RecN (Recombination protein N)